jgi:hypothetical protein
MTLTLEQRVANHLAEWPDSDLHACGRWLHGLWIIGNDYHRAVGYYGEFPPRFLQRLLAVFPDIRDDATKSILHVFSGSVSTANHSRAHVTRIEANENLKAEIHGDAERLAGHLAIYEAGKYAIPVSPFDLVIADPPYSKADAERYGFPYPNKKQVIEQIAKVTHKGAFLCWLDLMTPIFKKSQWHMMGLIHLWTGTNRKPRTLTIWRRV